MCVQRQLKKLFQNIQFMDIIDMLTVENKNYLEKKIQESIGKNEELINRIYLDINSCYINNKFQVNDVEVLQNVIDVIVLRAKGYVGCDFDELKKVIVCKLLIDLPDKIKLIGIPSCVYDLYPSAIDMVIQFLKKNEDVKYDEDFFLKDMCFVLGGSVPCGAQVVELYSHVSLYRALRSIVRIENFNSIIDFFKNGGPGRWFRVHTEARYLAEFNENGWENCYFRIAQLLKKYQDTKGLVGTSWFYDPQLVKISPRLSYLQRVPLDNGAFRVRHRGSSLDIERATLRSETRRRLYEDGLYRPICYSIFWPRQELLEWASRYERNNLL